MIETQAVDTGGEAQVPLGRYGKGSDVLKIVLATIRKTARRNSAAANVRTDAANAVLRAGAPTMIKMAATMEQKNDETKERISGKRRSKSTTQLRPEPKQKRVALQVSHLNQPQQRADAPGSADCSADRAGIDDPSIKKS